MESRGNRRISPAPNPGVAMSLTLPAQLSLPATSGHTFSLSDSAKPLVLYFTPRTTPPGCTTESMDFRDAYADFVAAGCQVGCRATDQVARKLQGQIIPAV